jgi:pyruvate carboxylase
MMAVKAYERGGLTEVQRVIDILKAVTSTPEAKLDEGVKEDRLILFVHANDALKNLLLGKFGKLPLGWPPDWVYQSVFGEKWHDAVAKRTEESPLNFLPPVDMEAVEAELAGHIGRTPTENEIVNYLNHPGDALKLIKNLEKYGDPNALPDDIWFEGLRVGHEREFVTSDGKVHSIKVLRIGKVDPHGRKRVRYKLDYEVFVEDIKVAERAVMGPGLEMADTKNVFHIAAPFDSDLWIVHKKEGEPVRAGEEVLNLSLMKTEYAVTSPVDGVVKRVVAFADYKADKKMVSVKKGALLMELASPRERCKNCDAEIEEDYKFCPTCGCNLESQ